MKTLLPILLMFVGGFIIGSQVFQSKKATANVSETDELPAKSAKTKTTNSNYNTNLNDDELATINLFEKASESVVYITTSSLSRDRWSMNVMEIPKGSGSGFVWNEDGYIVTNYHVVDGSDKISVTLSNQTSYPAKLIGAAPNKDLAVLKIDATYDALQPIPKGKSNGLRVGQSAYAIGNPFGLDQTLTTGIISALGREIKAKNGTTISDVIQTDAAINPGNSGGPLLDSSGRLIGVNTAIYSPSGAYAGIGFSIPVDEVLWVVPDLIKYGRVNRPFLGVELVPDQNFEEDGAMIMRTVPNGPAQQAGLQGVSQDGYGRLTYGDIITKIGNEVVKSSVDLTPILEQFEQGEEIPVEFIRSGAKLKTKLVLGSSVN